MPATDKIWEAISGISRFAALAVMADLGCADQLSAGPLTIDELARRCGVPVLPLARVFRELAAMDVVARTGPDTYSLTESGATLRTDAPGSTRTAVLMLAEEGYWYALGRLPQTVRQGRPAFIDRHGDWYDYLSNNPASRRLFDDFMAARSARFTPVIPAKYDFSDIRSLVDVGGAKGHILSSIMLAYPHLRGTLFDLAHVVAESRAFLAEHGLGDRCECVAGDFFTEVPTGADAYLLASIVHNWSDEDAVRILRNVRSAMAADSRVLIVEFVLPDDDRPHVGKDVDMRMLSVFDEGMERSRGQYASLLDRADLRLTRVIDLPGDAGVIEALPRDPASGAAVGGS